MYWKLRVSIKGGVKDSTRIDTHTIPLPSIIFLQQIYMLGMWGKRGWDYFPCRGAPLPNEPVWQCRRMNLPKANANDRTHENDANALSWHKVSASFWASALKDQFKSIILEWAIPEKKTRGFRTYFFEKRPRFFLIFSVPQEIPDKTKLHSWKFGKIM